MMTTTHEQRSAFTVAELIVVIAVTAVLAACLLPALAGTRTQARRLFCSNNLRQVGVAFRTWAAAHNGRTPMMETEYGGGSSGNVGYRALYADQRNSRGVCKMFLCLSNELGAPKVLFCPAEYETHNRQTATTFSGVGGTPGTVPYTNDLNVSYFVGVDAQESSPRMLLVGDHNLGGNTNPPTIAYLSAPSSGSPFISLGTNFNANQGPAFMDNTHLKQGNVGLADGSVECFSRSRLQDALKKAGDTGRNPRVFVLGAGSSSGSGCNRIQLP